MNRTQIMGTFKMLAKSQGFYGRLLRDIYELSVGAYDELMEELEAQNFSDAVDLIMYIEG